MKIMALRSIGKINSNVLQNCRRLFSYKFEMTAAARPASEQEEPIAAVSEEPVEMVNTNFRYNVCQPRTSPVEKPSIAGDALAAQRQNVKAAIEEQHLQPSMLPEYYQKQMERNALINPNPDPSEEDKVKINKINPKFQVSKTYANAVFPLKSVKLANPFPEPVKMMMSRTVSDDEKAEQMLAESKSQRQFADWGRVPSANPPHRAFSTAPQRMSKTVGRDPEKCKKYDGTKKGCPKLKTRDCPGPKRVNCDRLAKHIDCKKQEAPYPAYSEFCHEDIEERPSECKICPWKTDENPNFKPPKKHFHTSANMGMRRTGLEVDTVQECPPLASEEDPEGMLCDLRKGQCERPKNRRCPPTREEKRKKKEEERKKKEKECEGVSNEEIFLSEQVDPDGLSLRNEGPKPRSKGPCKTPKFKFPKCDPPRRSDVFGGRCPPKKKKPMIEDCPPCGKCSFEGEPTAITYEMKEEVKKDRRKCPHVDLNINKDEQQQQEDKCKVIKRGVTKICPADLLKKNKRKPRRPSYKKSSEVVPPVEIPTEPQQPTTM